MQADRSGRADEYADAYQESALFQENISLLSQGRGTESVSDEEIEKRYPITGHEGIIVKNLMKGQRSAAKWMRKQLTGK